MRLPWATALIYTCATHMLFAAVSFFPLDSLAAAKSASGCWDPTQEPAIKEIFTPNPKYHEDAKTIELIHDTIWSYREDIDPRLVYHRIIGESKGNPFALSGDGKFWGMFQFGGSPYRSKLSHRQLIENMQRKNPKVSPRLIQVRYYLEQYVQNFIKAADIGTGCIGNKKYHQYTNIERSTYLNFGDCGRAQMNQEIAKCTKKSDAPYSDACKFSYPVTRGHGSRLCERQNPGAQPHRSAPRSAVRNAASAR